jgi:transcriptional regulator with XRE-family HTH domain
MSNATIGAALRDARTRSGLSRRAVQQSTRGRLSATAIGGYERGERTITIDRFVELASALGVAPEDLLADALSAATPKERREVTIDLTRISEAAPSVREVVAAFAQTMRVRRGDLLGEVITLRSGDLGVLATRSERSASTLLRDLAPAVVHVGEPGNPAG